MCYPDALISVVVQISYESTTALNVPVVKQWLEARNFGFKKKRKCTIRVSKNKGADQLCS